MKIFIVFLLSTIASATAAQETTEPKQLTPVEVKACTERCDTNADKCMASGKSNKDYQKCDDEYSACLVSCNP